MAMLKNDMAALQAVLQTLDNEDGRSWLHHETGLATAEDVRIARAIVTALRAVDSVGPEPASDNWELMRNEVTGLHLYDNANDLMLPLGHLTDDEALTVRDALNRMARPTSSTDGAST